MSFMRFYRLRRISHGILNSLTYNRQVNVRDFAPERGRWMQNTDRCRRLYSVVAPSYRVNDVEKQHDNVSTHLIDEALVQLDRDARSIRRVCQKTVVHVFERIKQLGKVSSIQGLYIIRCCGLLMHDQVPAKRTELVNEIWSKLQELEVPMDASHYNALLKVFLENEHSFSAANFLSSMEEKGIEPNRVTYQRIIEKFCEDGDLNGASAVLEHMKEKGLSVNEGVFNSLIKGHAKMGDFEGAKNMMEVMRKSQLDPSADSYTVLACCLAEKGDIQHVISTLEEAKICGLHMTDKAYLRIIYSLAVQGFDEHIMQIFPMINDFRHYRQDCVNVILDLISNGKDETAFSLLLKICENVDFQNGVNIFVKHSVSIGMPVEKVIKYCSAMKDNDLSKFAISIATFSALESKNIEHAMEYIKAMQSQHMPVRGHYFWPILVLHGHKQNEKGIWSTLKTMGDLGLLADIDTFVDYVFPYVSTVDCEAVLRNVNDNGQSHLNAVNSLFKFYCTMGNLESAAYLCRNYAVQLNAKLLMQLLSQFKPSGEHDIAFLQILKYVSENMEPKLEGNPDIFGVVFAQLLGMNKLQESLLREAHKMGITLSRTSSDALCQKIGRNDPDAIQIIRNMQYGAAMPDVLEKHAVHPRDMSLEALEESLKKLKGTDANTRGILITLLTMYCKSKNLQKVIETRDELESQGFIFTPASYALMINVFVVFKNLDEASKLKKRLEEEYPDFKLDSVKTIAYMNLLLQCGKIEEAIDVMKNDCSEIEYPGLREPLLRGVKQLLRTAAETGDVKLTNDIFNSFMSALNITSPPIYFVEALINVHLVRDDLDAAIDEYKKCVLSYNMYPSRNSLFKKCILNNYSEKLQSILDCSIMHGRKNSALAELALCFIETGHTQEARNVILTLSGRSGMGYLEKLCARLTRLNKAQELEQFIAITKDLSHVDRDRLYFCLLQLHAENNDYQKGLEIWNSLQEESVQPSGRTLCLVADLLEKNNQSVPFVVPTHYNFVASEDQSSTLVDEIIPDFYQHLSAKNISGIITSLKQMKKGHIRSLSMNDMAKVVDLLLENNCVTELSSIVQVMSYLLEKPHLILKPLIEKYATAGEVEIMNSLLGFLPDFTQKHVNFNYFFYKAYITKGMQEVLLSHLEKNLKGNLKSFSNAGFQELLRSAPHLEERATRLADKYKEEEGFDLPRRVLWMHYFTHENFDKADEIYKLNPSLFTNVELLVAPMLKNVRNMQNDIVASKFLEFLQKCEAKQIARDRTYSCLLDILVARSKIAECSELLHKVQQLGVPFTVFSETTLANLKPLLENNGYDVPFKISLEEDSSSSDGEHE